MGLLSYLRKRYKHFRRYNQIMSILLKYGFEDLVSYMEEKKRFIFLRKFIPKRTHEQALHLSKWEKVRLACEELGPTFVKFGQLLSNRPDLLPADLVHEFEKLQDKVPPMPGTVAIGVVETELKGKVADLFADFEVDAFASASMAQVHKAKLKTGEEIALKVQRPGIKEVIESDIKVMYYLAEVFTRRIPSLKSFEPMELVKNFEESIQKELDFVRESVSIQRFHNSFKNHKDGQYVHSPLVYREFTTSKVLALEFINGVKISNLEHMHKNGLDRELIAKRLATSYFRQVFDFGFFHADPHPGNLFILPDNKICYLDYGMMGTILHKDMEHLGSLFLSVRSKDVRKIIRSLQSLSGHPVIRNFRDLEADLNDFVQNYAVREVHKNEMSTVLLELKDIIIKHGLKVPSHFFLLARSLVTIEGVVHFLDPNLDLARMARPYLIRTVAKNYNPLLFAKRLFNSAYEIAKYMEDFPRDLKNAIRKINQGEIKVDLRHKGIDPIVHTLHRMTRQVIAAVIIAALLVGSSLMIVASTPPLWGDSSAPAVFGFILAGYMSYRVLRDIRKGDHDEWPGWEE